MNHAELTCIDIRRVLYENPEFTNSDVNQHLQHCAACYRYSKVLLKQNEMLKQALEVPVPEGLSDKIIFNQHLEKSYKLKKWVAAACVALLFFSYISLVPKTKNHDWALISAQHVAAEEETLALNNSLVENDLKILDCLSGA